MSRRSSVAAVFAVALSFVAARSASAQEATPERASTPSLFAAANTSSVTLANTPPPAVPAFDGPQIPLSILRGRPESRHSTSLLPLYASTIVLQALDVHSTMTAMSRGAVEGNPLMAGLTAHKPAFVAMKVGIAASTVFAMKNIAKRNKLAAVAALIGINSAYAMVVSHNYKLAQSLR